MTTNFEPPPPPENGGPPGEGAPAPNPWEPYVQAFERAGLDPARMPPPAQLIDSYNASSAWRDPDRVKPTAEAWLRNANVVPGLGETVQMDELIDYATQLNEQRSNPFNQFVPGQGQMDPAQYAQYQQQQYADPGQYEPQVDPQALAQAVEQIVERRLKAHQEQEAQQRNEREFANQMESQLQRVVAKHELTDDMAERVRAIGWANLYQGRVQQYEVDAVMENAYSSLKGLMDAEFARRAGQQADQSGGQAPPPKGAPASGGQVAPNFAELRRRLSGE